MVLRVALGLLCGVLTASVAEGGFAQSAAQWAMRPFQQEEKTIEIRGRQLLVNGQPIHLKGVCWSPVPLGGEDPSALDRDGFVEQDSALMVEAGMNVIRMYEPLLNRTTLDTLWSKGIYVINMAYIWGGDALSNIAPRINAVKDHPAILMWEVGNEWNYNNFYYGANEPGGDLLTFEQARQRAFDVVKEIKVHDQVHPVSTVYGELPSEETLEILSEVDVWAINAYRSADFGDLFSVWSQRSEKPMYFGEYGADAWDAREEYNVTNLTAQAYATRVLTEQINLHTSLAGGVCLGGMIFELTDEWWKAGNPDEHDVGGVAPGGGPYPDLAFNEEWWGICEIDRTCRPAFYEYKDIPIPTGPKAPGMWPQQAVWIAIAAAIALGGLLACWCYVNRAEDPADQHLPTTEMS